MKEAVAAPVLLLNVFEALQVQAEHMRQRFDLHPLLGVLQPLACVAEEFVVPIQSFRCAAYITGTLSWERRTHVILHTCTGTTLG